jgi:hypothetical protein
MYKIVNQLQKKKKMIILQNKRTLVKFYALLRHIIDRHKFNQLRIRSGGSNTFLKRRAGGTV